MDADIAATYDAYPYPAYAFWFTHPNQLAVMATLFGLDPAPPRSCRLLEVGCAVGGNLLPMAASLPGAQFVGLDVSGVQIAQARAAAAELGLTNVSFVHADLRDLDPALGPFDYIVAHGVFSWVSDDVRAAFLDLCRARLTPHGVAYVSYNTLPGWHTAGVLRDFMRLHTDPFDDPGLKIAQGLAIGEWLVDRVSRRPDDFRAPFLAAELNNARSLPGTTALHEYLAPDNRPFYFTDFLALAQAHGLDYLSDAKPWDMWLDNYDGQVGEVLEQLPSLVRQAQYLDFVTHRRFRQTLLRHAHTPVQRRIDTSVVERFTLHATCGAEPGLAALDTGAPVSVANPNRGPLEISGVVPRLALHLLWRHGRRGQPFAALFDDLVAALDARGLGAGRTDSPAAQAELRRSLDRALVRLFFGELVSFSLEPPALTTTAPSFPRTGALQRWQAARGDGATNLAHEHLPLGPAARAVLAHLDGTYDALLLQTLHPDPIDATLADLAAAGFLLADP